MLARLEDSVVVVVDLQPSFLAAIHRRDEILKRSKFLLEVARSLMVPSMASEQYPERMGGTDESVASLIGGHPLSKMAFSCCGIQQFNDSLSSLGRKQTILVGIETHICVNQTAHHLVESGHEVIVCADAVSARSQEQHEIGLTRMRDIGVTIAHTESVAYEWMGGADHERFRDILNLVKAY